MTLLFNLHYDFACTTRLLWSSFNTITVIVDYSHVAYLSTPSVRISTNPSKRFPNTTRELESDQACKHHDIFASLDAPLDCFLLRTGLEFRIPQLVDVIATSNHSPKHDVAYRPSNDGRRQIERLRLLTDCRNIATSFGGQ